MLASGFGLDRICLHLETEGYRTQLNRDDSRLRSVVSGAEGQVFGIYAFYLDGLDEFDNLRFALVRSSDECDLTLGQLNKLNGQFLVSKIYRDDEGNVMLRHSLQVLESEMTSDIFEENFRCWLNDLTTFAKSNSLNLKD